MATSTELSQLFKPQTNNIQDSLVAIQISGKKYTQNAFTSTRDWSTAGTSGGYIYHLNWHRGHRNSNKDLKLTPLSGAGTPLSVSVTLNRTLSTVASTFFAQGTVTKGVDNEMGGKVSIELFPDCAPKSDGTSCTFASQTYNIGSMNQAFFEVRVQAENPASTRHYRLNISATLSA